MSSPIRVVLETARKKSFASALDWPGWSRPGKTPESAMQALADYASRYAIVVERAKLPAAEVIDAAFDVIETVEGTPTTEFGAPDVPSSVESEPMSEEECERQIALLRSAWEMFDDTAGRVSEELQKGPRGGGRNRTKMINHVHEAERAYMHHLGVKTPKGAMATPEGLATQRDVICEAIRDHAARATKPGNGRCATSSVARHGTCSTTRGRWRTRISPSGSMRQYRLNCKCRPPRCPNKLNKLTWFPQISILGLQGLDANNGIWSGVA